MTEPSLSQAPLAQILTDPARRPAAVDALAAAVEAEVQSRSGLSAVALKAGYKAVTSVKPDLVRKAVNRMLPDFADKLEPFWASRGTTPFGEHLAANGAAASDALLQVTDERANKPDHAAVAKVYNGLRPKARGLVEQGLPRIGATIESLAR